MLRTYRMVGGRPLRVGYEISSLAQTSAGTSRHVACLAEALEDEGVELHRLSFGGASRAEAVARDVAWYLAGLPVAAERARVDLLHCPTFRAPLACRRPLVVTFHDLAVLRHPQLFNRWSRSYGRVVLPGVARAARAVIAVSSFTRREVLELLDVDDDRVHVVHNGVGPPFSVAGPKADGDYILAVGTLEPRKNLARLLAGFRSADLPDIELRVAGAQGWGGVDVHGDGVRWLGEVPDEELARLYRGARCVAYVSLYEGFGLPVLEAMACGAPVVISRADALREVAGDAAVVVDGLDPESIAAGLEEAVARRAELSALGLERAAAFTWRDAARRTVDVYRSVAA
jgi:glycosyltransferase involved in cell wall biosynthesis